MSRGPQPTAAMIDHMSGDPLLFFENVVVRTGSGVHRFGNIMAPFQRERFKAIAPALLALARGKKPPIGKHWWEATKGCSKDSDLALCVLWLLAFSGRSITCQVGAADQDQAAELRKAAKLVLEFNPWLAGIVRVHNWKIVCEGTGSEAEIVAADTAGSHGARPDVLILNELTHITKWGFAENLLDNASKVPFGLTVVATNAGFTSTDAYRWREMAREAEGRWFFHVYNKPAPWLDPAEVEEARKRNPAARFARLFGGVWTSGTGDALQATDIDAAIKNDGVPFDKRTVYVGGLDLSTTRDHTAFVVVGRNEAGRYSVARVKLWRPKEQQGGRIDQGEVERYIIEAHAVFPLSRLAVDPNQADYLIARLKKAGIRAEHRYQHGGTTLDEQCMTLLDAFISRNIDIPDNDDLTRDLRNLRTIDRGTWMRLASERNAHGHGDIATALSIALAVAKDAPKKRTFAAGVSSDEDIRAAIMEAASKPGDPADGPVVREYSEDSMIQPDAMNPGYPRPMSLFSALAAARRSMND